MDISKLDIVLASSSPRRIEMMREHGVNPLVIKPQCEEDLPEGIGMKEAVMLLSLRKALEVENILKEGKFESIERSAEIIEKAPYIIASDTVVYYNHIIGKPENRDHARQILSELNGKVHYVTTGVTILQAGKPVRRSFAEVSEVHFKSYTCEELEAYLDTDEPYDKAGAYAIQGIFGKHIDHIVGDYNNIVGFPWNRVQAELENLINLK